MADQICFSFVELRHLDALLNPTVIFVSSVKQRILPGVEMAVMTNGVQRRLCLQMDS